jgi:general L-amino acid transport system substrate-binding protein
MDRIRAAHSLNCAVIKEEEDYSRAEDHGNRAAFDIDMCKAVAVAILGPGARFVIKPYPDEPAALKALQHADVDLIASASPLVNSSVAGVGFTRPTFYDGQGLMFLNNPAIHSATDFAGKKVCFLLSTNSETGIHDYAARQHISYIWFGFSEAGEMDAAFFTGNCDALSGDVSQLANVRAHDRARANDFTILPELIRKDPLAPAFDAADSRFAAIVTWTVETLIEAEELDVTQKNVDTMLSSEDAEVKDLLGHRYGTGAHLGLDDHWGANVIKATGNYGEIFDRDLGQDSPLRLDRGANRLWTRGGLMMAIPPSN